MYIIYLKADALPPTPGLEGRGDGGPGSWKAIWTVDNGQWTVDRAQRIGLEIQWTVDSGQIIILCYIISYYNL